jgi:hypothetical protein
MKLPFRYPRRCARGIPSSLKCRRKIVIRALESIMAERSDMPVALPAASLRETPAHVNTERRAGVRFPFTAAAEIYEIRSETRLTGRCSDLGYGGCYVDTLSPLGVGTSVRIHIERDLRDFEAAGVVAYAHVSLGMGLAFTEIKDEYRGILHSWIAELSGDESHKPAVSAAGPETGIYDSIANLRQVFNEFINLMVRKKIITENDAAGLLRQLFR